MGDEDEDTEASLSAEFEAWCYDQKLPWQDAQELLMRDDLDETQREWLNAFCTRWENMLDAK